MALLCFPLVSWAERKGDKSVGQQLSCQEWKEEDSLVRGIPFCSSELSASSNPCFPRHSILFMESVANTAYKILSGFSLLNPPAPSCMRRRAICTPFDISPKDSAKLFGSCLPVCRQFMSRLRGAITRMWLICVEKSEWTWRARGDEEQSPRTCAGARWGCKWAWQASLGAVSLLPGTLWKILNSELGAVWDTKNATPVKEIKVPKVVSEMGNSVFQVDLSSQFYQWPARWVNVISLTCFCSKPMSFTPHKSYF